MKEYFSYDDVLIKPLYSEVRSRSTVDVSTSLNSWIKLDIPIIASNMDTVCEYNMAKSMAEFGGLGVVHRNLPHATRIHNVRRLTELGLLSAVAVGVNEYDDAPFNRYMDEGVDVFVLDIAHGDSLHALRAVEGLRSIAERYGNKTCIVGGNVATPDGVERMANAGAHSVKVGIGPGAACLTRVNTGVGVPQLSCIMECAERADFLGLSVIADGGVKTPGDVAKAIAAGADAVMLGSMLAGTDEAPGSVRTVRGQRVKSYRGMASGGAGSKYVEGAEGYVPYKGAAFEVVSAIINGLRSAISYCGAFSISEMQSKVEFIKVSPLSLSENGAHGTIL